jgi:choline dehydrogenase-like flavoprotein
VHQVKQFSPRISLGCSISSKPYLALAMLDYPNFGHWVDSEFTKLGVYYAMVDGGGRGSVRSIPGFADPLVRYRVSEEGRRDLAFGLRVLCQALLKAGATEIFPSITGFGSPIRTVADLTRIPNELPANRVQLMTIHVLGSCPMGEASAAAVCDSFGHVKGHPALTINDASLLCDSPGVNPQGTVMLLARRNILHHLGNL